MKMFINLSIKNKLIIIVLIVTTIAIGIGFTLVTINDINTYKKDLVNSTKVSANLISEYCIAPLTFRDQKAATTIIEKIKTVPSITTACIYDENGKLFASFQKVPDGDLPGSVIAQEKSVFEEGNLKVFTPIKLTDIIYGTVYLKVSTDLLNKEIQQHLIIMISIMLGLIILSYFIASRLQTIISKPILSLAHTTNKITQDADYSLRVNKQGSDEIGLLYDSFNEMLAQLNKRQEERSNAEKLLRESETKYRSIVDTAIEGIWGFGADILTNFVNNRMAEILGYSKEEMYGRPITDFMFKEDLPDHLKKMENRRYGVSESYERRFYHKNGQTVWTFVSATPVFDDELHFNGSFGMFTDITERKLTEEKIKSLNEEEKTRHEQLIEKNLELKKARNATLNIIEDLSKEIEEKRQAQQKIVQLAAIVESSDDAITGKTLDGIITSWNRGAVNLYGYTESEMIGKHISVLVPDDRTDEVIDILEKIKIGEHIEHFETLRKRKDGQLIDVSLTISPVLDSDGKPIGASTIGRDITERKQSEKALRLSEEKYRLLHNNAGVGIGYYDTNGVIISYNNLAASYMQGKPEDFIGKSVYDVFPKQEADFYFERIKLSMASESTIEFEDYLNLPNGEKWFLSVFSRICDLQNNVIGVQIISQDVTERKFAERAIRKSEKKYRTLIQNIQIAVVVHGPDTQILTCNPAAENLLGLSEEQLLGKKAIENDWHFLYEDGSVLPVEEYPVNKVLATKQPLRNFTIGIRQHADENVVWALVNGDPVFGSEDEIIQIIITFIDITERKKIEEALRESEWKFREIFNNVLDALYLLEVTSDGHFVTIEVNPALEKLTGIPRSQSIGKTQEETVSEEVAHLVNAKYRRCIEEAQPIEEEVRLDLPTGYRYFHSTLIPARNEFGNIHRIVGISRDITERKLAEEQILKLNAELEQRVFERTAQLEAANKELEAFAYSVSHDLRAPLRGIDGFSQVLLEEYQDKIDDDGKNYLNRIRSGAQRMAQLIDDMLTLSRVSRGEMNIQELDLSNMVRSVTNELCESYPERKMDFVIQDGVKVHADARLLNIVLENLIGNAVKFTSKHSTAKIEFGTQLQKDEIVYFIRDDGAGFDMDYSSKLFGAFQRLHAVTEFPGTGIGLATVQRVIHRHGGRVWAEGAIEKGATFYFTIT